jgi:hypothetical protein
MNNIGPVAQLDTCLPARSIKKKFWSGSSIG